LLDPHSDQFGHLEFLFIFLIRENDV
jgi:hypothetical protein